MKTILLLFLLMAPLAFADIGPGPVAPSVNVNLVDNGKPFTDPIILTYLCSVPNATDSPVGERVINFTCENSVCTNSQWFYKFNPCFYPENGTFRYTLTKTRSGMITTLETAAFPQGENYSLVLDVGTRHLSGGNPPPSPPSPCPAAVLVLLPLAALCYHFRRH